ncbi:hypothetical protein [Lacipirellula parvula]|uniref:Uncharacterized protein n=1 Tax=Lacipirellula parvula TaxID=2650471 RepID=A0A5K7XGJ5_9BACT|nr:hypothetical protein [Lacipirellula parvula]BBO34041.1 hypothetical protein PLANPX_3653 [Lacipirellula parvula]
MRKLETQLIIARELGFADGKSMESLFSMTDQESKMLSGLMRTVKDTL